MTDKLLTITEVAELTRLSEATLRWFRHCGKGPKLSPASSGAASCIANPTSSSGSTHSSIPTPSGLWPDGAPLGARCESLLELRQIGGRWGLVRAMW